MNPRREYHQQYYLQNKAKYKERARKWYLDNKETITPKIAAYRANNKDRYLAYQEEYRSNPENKAKTNAYTRHRYRTDEKFRETVKAHSASYIWNFTEEFTYEVLLELRSQDCFYCGGPGGSVDHLVPRSKGGTDRLDNLVPACVSCNSSKNARDLADFYASK